MNKIDDKILYYMDRLAKNNFLEKFMMFWTFMGDFCFVWIVYVFYAYVSGERKLAGMLIVVMLVVNAINNGLFKAIFRRKRPFEDHPDIKIAIDNPYGSSFPSGHSANGFACAVIIMSFYPNYGFIALVIATLIALSRMFLKVHYFSDVLVGSLIGVLISIIYLGFL